MPPTGLQPTSAARTVTHARIWIMGELKATFTTYGPAIGAINSSRGDKLFGEIPGEERTLPPSVADLICDYERTTGPNAVVEPRRVVRGDIARSLFYMHIEYKLDLKSMLSMLKRWHGADPPNAATCFYFPARHCDI
jgi:deoxyribonuclease I